MILPRAGREINIAGTLVGRMLVEILNGNGTGLVEHLAYSYSIIIMMRIGIVLASVRSNQDTVQTGAA